MQLSNAQLLKKTDPQMSPALTVLISNCNWQDLDSCPIDKSRLRIESSNAIVRSHLDEGGILQGYIRSFSRISFWTGNKPDGQDGGFATVRGLTAFVSHIAPVCFWVEGPLRWAREPNNRHSVGLPASINLPEPHSLALLSKARTILATATNNDNLLTLPREELLITAGQAAMDRFEYVEGVELPTPSNVLGMLFYEGIDYEY
jgi:hypothetical protein